MPLTVNTSRYITLVVITALQLLRKRRLGQGHPTTVSSFRAKDPPPSPIFNSVLSQQGCNGLSIPEILRNVRILDQPFSLEPLEPPLPDILATPLKQVKFFGEFKLQENCAINTRHQKAFGASVLSKNRC